MIGVHFADPWRNDEPARGLDTVETFPEELEPPYYHDNGSQWRIYNFGTDEWHIRRHELAEIALGLRRAGKDREAEKAWAKWDRCNPSLPWLKGL